jgi:hypothetical protein
MENKKDYYSTFNFYNEKGQRLSIFATEQVDNFTQMKELKVCVVACSKKDAFTKKLLRDAFEYFKLNGIFPPTPEKKEYHPQFYYVPIEDNKPKFTFIKWCRENFYKLYSTRDDLALDDSCIITETRIVRGKWFKEIETKYLYKNDTGKS